MASTAPTHPESREPIYRLARLLARQAVADYLTQESEKKQQDIDARTNRAVSQSRKAV